MFYTPNLFKDGLSALLYYPSQHPIKLLTIIVYHTMLRFSILVSIYYPLILSIYLSIYLTKVAVIRATKSRNSSLNVVALQVAERMLRVLQPRAQKLSLLQRVETASLRATKSCNKNWSGKRAIFTLQLTTQECFATRWTILLLVLLHLSACLYIFLAVCLVVCLVLLCFNLVSVQ